MKTHDVVHDNGKIIYRIELFILLMLTYRIFQTSIIIYVFKSSVIYNAYLRKIKLLYYKLKIRSYFYIYNKNS